MMTSTRMKTAGSMSRTSEGSTSCMMRLLKTSSKSYRCHNVVVDA